MFYHRNTHAFFISNTFISKVRLKWEKIKQNPTMRSNFCNLKTINFLHPHDHPKIIEDIFKKCKEQMIVLMRLNLIKMKWKIKKMDNIDTT